MSDKKKVKLLNVAVCLSGILFIFCLCMALQVRMTYVQASEQYSTVKKRAVVEIPDTESGDTVKKIDFGILQSEGSAASLWLDIPGTRVDYPLVQGEDNKIYLSTDAYGEPSGAGAIFIDSRDDGTLQGERTLIYGHNMKDGSMFHDLLQYQEESFAKEHAVLHIYTPDGKVLTYRLLCTVKTTNQNGVIYGDVEGRTSTEIATMLLPEAAGIYGEVKGGKLLMLSTCIKHDRRYVCVFQKEMEKEYND